MTRRIPLSPQDAVSDRASQRRGRVESGGRIAEPVDAKDGVGAAAVRNVKSPAKKNLDYPDRQLKDYKTR